jgi:lipopolysaccharide/colanic/teichoic acid biosynthesis glycosyltransferase
MNAPVARVTGSLRKRARARAKALRMPLMPSLQQRRLQCHMVYMLTDAALLFASFMLSAMLLGLDGFSTQTLLVPQIILPVYLTIGLYNGAYSLNALSSRTFSVSRSLGALVMAAVVVTFITFYTRSAETYSRSVFTLGVGASAALMAAGRVVLRQFVRWRCGVAVINQLVIDDGGPSISLPGAFHVSAQSFALVPTLSDPNALDRIGMVMRNADRVVVSSTPERCANWSIILKGANVDGEVVDDNVYRLSAQGARLDGGRGLLQVSVGPMGLRDRLQKRALDLFVAGSACLALLPLFILVALAIKLEDGGPVFFVQRRVGRANRFFPILKFRSMTVNKIGRDGSQSASKDDKRITRIGKIIRSTSIDELPQLLNVLRGDMSLVGPRPHATGSLAGDKLFWEVDPRYWERHALKPGLTGLAQIRGYRGATDREEDLSLRLTADLEYLRGWSLWRDLWIIVATFKVLVHDKAF